MSITNTFTERYNLFKEDGSFEKVLKEHVISTSTAVPKLGLMMVGLGGNNGSTLTAGLLAHKHKIEWETKEGLHTPNFYGSFTQCATCWTGIRQSADGKIQDVYTPINKLLPMVNPVDIEITGWDISNKNLFESCKRAQVLEPDLVNRLHDQLSAIKPLPAAFNAEFIAAN